MRHFVTQGSLPLVAVLGCGFSLPVCGCVRIFLIDYDCIAYCLFVYRLRLRARVPRVRVLIRALLLLLLRVCCCMYTYV